MPITNSESILIIDEELIRKMEQISRLGVPLRRDDVEAILAR
jgi:hypothetical protein